jgi:hypothetical protein
LKISFITDTIQTLSETSKQQLPSRHRTLLAGFFLALAFNPADGSNTLDSFRATIHYNPEDSILHTHGCVENGDEKVYFYLASTTELMASVR